MSRHVDLLEPIDFRACAPRLRLYLSQVCELAGISKMQLDYWTNKAGIVTHGRKQRVYDYESIVLVLLIKQARDKGLSLPAAIEAAREFIARGQHVVAATGEPRRASTLPSGFSEVIALDA